jgi:hypothetical protein
VKADKALQSGAARRRYCYLRLTLLMLLFGTLSPAHASETKECDSHFAADLWSETDIRIAGIDLVGTACPSAHSMVRLGVSYYADDKFAYRGVTAGGRLYMGRVLSPYVGLGFLGGYAETEQSAHGDGVDNDGDGSVDESGENKAFRDTSVFAFPEIGVIFQPGRFGVTIAARRFYGREFNGDVIYSVGLSLALGAE